MNLILQRLSRRPRAAAAAAAILGSLALGGLSGPQRALIIDADELKGLMADHTFYGRYTSNTQDWIEYYAPDGRLGYWDGCPHSGRWWIEWAPGINGAGAAAACFNYPTMVGANTFCFDVYRVSSVPSGSRLEFLTLGTSPALPALAYTRAIASGNPEHLSLTASGCQVSSVTPP